MKIAVEAPNFAKEILFHLCHSTQAERRFVQTNGHLLPAIPGDGKSVAAGEKDRDGEKWGLQIYIYIYIYYIYIDWSDVK